MRRHRFIIPDIVLAEDVVGIRDANLAHQLRSVLRIRPGDEILVADGSGSEAVATIQGYTEGAVMLAVQAPQALATEPLRSVTIYAAVTKRDTFEWACQKATECGVTRIVPMITERTVKPNLNLVRVRAIVKEAAEQSGRGSVPEVESSMPYLDAILERVGGLKFIASTLGGQNLHEIEMGDEDVAILIGPEGGFSDKEEKEATDAGWQPISLGSRILRAETAVAISTYLLAR